MSSPKSAAVKNVDIADIFESEISAKAISTKLYNKPTKQPDSRSRTCPLQVRDLLALVECYPKQTTSSQVDDIVLQWAQISKFFCP